MWENIVVEPIFNFLIWIYAVLPIKNFGLALIVATLLVRFALGPIVRRQVRHTKALRDLQPELKKIKKAAGGNRQQEALATMALYKEKGFNPFAPFGYLLLQIPVFIGFYQVINRLANPAPETVADKLNNHSYSSIADIGVIESIREGATSFNSSFLGIDLAVIVWGSTGIVIGGLLIAVVCALSQYYTTKQLMRYQQPDMKSGRGSLAQLRQAWQDQKAGRAVDQSTVSQAVSGSLIYFFPALILLISLKLVVALPFYWLVNNIATYYQQKRAYQGLVDKAAGPLTTTRDGRPVIEAKIIKKGGNEAKQTTETQSRPLNAKEKKLAAQRKRQRN